MPSLVSIVMPCYKGEAFVRAALESCLGQTYRDLEVVFVDDCSPDHSVEIAREIARRDPRVRIVQRAKNGGISAALNSGLAVARGQYLTRLAADDLFFPTAIEALVRGFEDDSDAGLVYCDMLAIDEQGKQLQPMVVKPPESAFFPNNRVGVCVMWRRTVYERIGGFDETMQAAGEDYDFWLRASHEFRFCKLAVPPQLGYRIHGGQNSRQERLLNINSMRAQMKYFAQRRMWVRYVKRWLRLIQYKFKRRA